MIALDTNVLVRFLTQDDPVQGRAARDLIDTLSDANPGFLPREVIIETVWVLERAYKFSRREIAMALEGLLEAQELIVEAADDVGLALSRYRKGGAGFSDHMILAISQRAGCDTVYTFDRKAGAEPGATLIP